MYDHLNLRTPQPAHNPFKDVDDWWYVINRCVSSTIQGRNFWTKLDGKWDRNRRTKTLKDLVSPRDLQWAEGAIRSRK